MPTLVPFLSVCLFVLLNSDMFDFILCYHILSFLLLSLRRVFAFQWEKESGWIWRERRWGVAGKRRRRGNHNQDRFLIKYLFSTKEKKEKWQRKHIVTVESWWGCGLAELQTQGLLGETWRFCWQYSSIWITIPKVTGCAEARQFFSKMQSTRFQHLFWKLKVVSIQLIYW